MAAVAVGTGAKRLLAYLVLMFVQNRSRIIMMRMLHHTITE